MNTRKEFGDFQTPLPLAHEIITLIDELIGPPDIVIEPTAGLGSFLDAAQTKWRGHATYQGYEINPAYVSEAKAHLLARGVQLYRQDFFDADWQRILATSGEGKTLVVGNPPWVTNATLGVLNSSNLPTKTNFQRLRGFDAKTGKTKTARKVLRHLWKTTGGLADSSLFLIDAKLHFGVSVDACLFMARGERCTERTATVYAALSKDSRMSKFGLVDGQLVSDIDSYCKYRELDGGSPYAWRSGVKHDASSIMELTPYKGHS